MSTRVATICGCGRPTRKPVKGRCEQCAAPSEIARTLRRRDDEPWSRLYNHRAWRRTRLIVFERDGWRCRLRLAGCLGAKRLRGHHTPKPIAELWRMTAGDFKAFIALACDPERVTTACERCHVADDAQRRASSKGGHPSGAHGRGDSAAGHHFQRPGFSPDFGANFFF